MAATGKAIAETAVKVRSFIIDFSIATLRALAEGLVITAEDGGACIAEGNDLIGLGAARHFHARRTDPHSGNREAGKSRKSWDSGSKRCRRSVEPVLTNRAQSWQSASAS